VSHFFILTRIYFILELLSIYDLSSIIFIIYRNESLLTLRVLLHPCWRIHNSLSSLTS